MASTTLKFLIVGQDVSGSEAFSKLARNVDGASRSVDKNSAALLAQSKTADVSARATLALAKSDKTLRDAALELAVAEGRLTRAEAEQARGAEEAAVKTRAAGEAAKGAGGGFTALQSPMVAAVGAGVALAPVAVTLAAGLGGLGLAALGAAKDARAMHGVLSPLKAEVASFQASLKPQLLNLFADGASIAETGLKGLQPVAAATGTALHGVLGAINANFKSGEWQQFFGFMERTAGPDIQLLGRLFIDLSNDIPPVLETLQPVATGLLKITDAIVRIPAVLDQVKAKTGANQPGFFGGTGLDRIREFISWGEKHIPAGNKSISDLIGLTGRSAAVASAAGSAVASVGASAAVAAPKVGTLAGDMGILNATVGSGNSVLAAYSDLWGRFVGKSVSDQQAILNMRQAFEQFNAAVKGSGRASTAAQQAFLSIFTTIGSGLDTLHQNGASIRQLNDYYTTSIARLNALHGLTPAQRADVQGLTKDYLAWAGSVSGLSGNVVRAAGSIRDTLLAQLTMSHRLVPQVSQDASALANAILKTGTNSRATAMDRQRLIADFERSGLTAIQARQAAASFQRQVDALHGKTVNVDVTASGSGGFSVGATGLAARIFKLAHLAKGARIPGFGGGDVHPALLEGGETVVDKYTSRQLAPVFKAAGVPGYAAGGIAGTSPFVAGQAGSILQGWAGADITAMANAMISQLAATMSGGFTGPGSTALGGDAAANKALARSMFPWPASMWPSFDYLEMREAGYNRFARNPSSGAYGIPQALPESKLPFAGQSAGGSHAGPQLSWMYAYIGGRYGNPVNAAAHERAVSWYAGGLDAIFGKPTIIGVGERGKEHVTVTPVGKEPAWATLHQWLLDRQHGKALTGTQLHWLHVAHLQHLAHLAALGRGGTPTVTIPPPVSTTTSVSGVPGPRGGDGGRVYSITVNVAPGTHPAQTGKAIVTAIKEYERLSGRGWRTP